MKGILTQLQPQSPNRHEQLTGFSRKLKTRHDRPQLPSQQPPRREPHPPALIKKHINPVKPHAQNRPTSQTVGPGQTIPKGCTDRSIQGCYGRPLLGKGVQRAKSAALHNSLIVESSHPSIHISQKPPRLANMGFHTHNHLSNIQLQRKAGRKHIDNLRAEMPMHTKKSPQTTVIEHPKLPSHILAQGLRSWQQ